MESHGQKLNFFKFKMEAAAMLKIGFLAITHQPIVRFQRNLYEEADRHASKGHMTNTAIFKNPRWQTAAILKIVKSPYLSKKSWFWWNLIHCSRYWTQWETRDQQLKYIQFKMVAATILKIAFLAITHQAIVRFQQNFVRGSGTACHASKGHVAKTANF